MSAEGSLSMTQRSALLLALCSPCSLILDHKGRVLDAPEPLVPLLGESLLEWVAVEDQAALESFLQQLYTQSSEALLEVRLAFPAESVVVITGRTFQLCSPPGALLQIHPHSSQQKNSGHLEQMEAAFISAAHGMLIIRAGTAEIVQVNNRFLEMLGRTRQEMVARPAHQFLTAEALQGLQKHAVEAREKGHHQFITTFQPLHGKAFDAQVDLTALKNHGEITHWVVGVQDVTAEQLAAERSTRLAHLALELSGATSMEQVVAAMLQKTAEASQASRAGLFLVTPEGTHLSLVDHLNYPSKALEQVRHLPITPTFPVGSAALEKRSLFLTVDEMQERYPSTSTLRSSTTQSVAAIPLVVEGQLKAVLALSFNADRKFDAAEQDFLELLTHQCAQALERMRLRSEKEQSQQQAAWDIAQREQQFHSLVLNVPGVVYRCLLDSEWTTLFMSGRVRELTGHHPEEFTRPGGLTYASLIHPEDRLRVEQQVKAAVNNQKPFDVEYRILHRDGTVRWVQEQGRAFANPDGQVLWLDGVMLDITSRREVEEERKKLLEEVELEQARLTQVLDQMPVAVWLGEVPSGKLLLGNQQIQHIWGHGFLGADDIEGYRRYHGFHPDGQPVLPHEWPLARTIATGEVITNEEIHVQWPDGRLVPVWFSASPIINPAGERIAGVVTGLNISNIKRAEQALQTAKTTLEARVEERTRELKTLSDILQQQVRTLEERNQQAQVLSEMGELLQACQSLPEAYEVISQHVELLFPQAQGALYAFGPSRNVLEELVHWNGQPESDSVFTPQECWAVRRGRVFIHKAHSGGIQCKHIPNPGVATLCLPLLAQGDTIGQMHLSTQGGAFSEEQQRLAQTVGETVALALVNLRLRDRLKEQSIRDALTGLFNRRYMEETFAREMHRAQRHSNPVALLMLDLDHFKQFNDTHGHEVGDLLLTEFGALLRASVRNEDIACRYGGEEFTMLLPGADSEDALGRAEQIRQATSLLQVKNRGKVTGPVTCSIGVANFPTHGSHLADLLRAADLALYEAKKHGRNRVEVAHLEP